MHFLSKKVSCSPKSVAFTQATLHCLTKTLFSRDTWHSPKKLCSLTNNLQKFLAKVQHAPKSIPFPQETLSSLAKKELHFPQTTEETLHSFAIFSPTILVQPALALFTIFGHFCLNCAIFEFYINMFASYTNTYHTYQ